jgi:phosphonopyruvate decarboxylase
MIKVNTLINLLKKNNTNFFTGVPDIATNEGAAVSIGIGHYLSTKKIPCIYMQNSGLSNALNPLISIAHKKVYSIPLILMIGWRGSPRVKDEPQHNVKGKITQQILKLLDIKYTILRSNKDFSNFDKQIKYAKRNHSIVACLIEQGTLQKITTSSSKKDFYNLDKEFFLKNLLEKLPSNSKVIASTGYNSRELMYLRKKFNFNNSKDFYMVGGMGHTSSVALGFSLSSKNKTFCIDGDGSFLMHLGSIMTVGNFANKNFKYILLNNNSHDSVGGQSTNADNINFDKLSKSLGFKKFYLIKKKQNLNKIIKNFIKISGPAFLEVKVTNCKIKKLPRPDDLIKIKNQFMK